MEKTPDYSKCSPRELEDVATRINREKFADRYALVLSEIKRREALGEEAAAPRKVKTTARVVRADVTYLIGGIAGFVFYSLMPFAVEMSPDTPDGIVESTVAIAVGALLAGVVRRIYLGQPDES